MPLIQSQQAYHHHLSFLCWGILSLLYVAGYTHTWNWGLGFSFRLPPGSGRNGGSPLPRSGQKQRASEKAVTVSDTLRQTSLPLFLGGALPPSSPGSYLFSFDFLFFKFGCLLPYLGIHAPSSTFLLWVYMEVTWVYCEGSWQICDPSISAGLYV